MNPVAVGNNVVVMVCVLVYVVEVIVVEGVEVVNCCGAVSCEIGLTTRLILDRVYEQVSWW